MTTTTAQTGSFPSPYEIATPEGCEGWEEMYPYYALFDERRRETDENGSGSGTRCISRSRCRRST